MPFPTDETFISRAEKALGVRLPAQYREYLLRSNGGEAASDSDNWQVFPVFDDSDRRRAARSASHIVQETETARCWRNFPGAGVAFAANSCGDRLVFLPSESDAGVLEQAMHLWRHETGVCSRLVTSFDEFAGGAGDF
jgi:hypothetical protein